MKARRFLKPRPDEINQSGIDSLFKTDRAEANHQHIVSELASFVISNGLDPKESKSVDMIVECGMEHILIEVKSSTSENFYRQCVTGAIQVLGYVYAMKSEQLIDTTPIVVVEHSIVGDLGLYFRSFLDFLGVKLMIYHDDQAWPQKIPRFVELLSK